QRRAQIHSAARDRTRTRAPFGERKWAPADRLQIYIARTAAGRRASPTLLPPGERTGPGTQEDLHGRSSFAGARQVGEARVRGLRARLHKEAGGARSRAASSGVLGKPAI